MKYIKKFIRFARHILGNLLRAIYVGYLRLGGVKIGINTMISLGARIDMRRGEVVIGDNCLITHGCYILSHDGAARLVNPGSDGFGKVIIGDNVFVGVNSVILPNVTIGENSVIGSGAVVTKDVPPESLVVGNPARVIRKLTPPFSVLNAPPSK
jgi:acetyltransferase-like isoleucine patch superfamily enzyme